MATETLLFQKKSEKRENMQAFEIWNKKTNLKIQLSNHAIARIRANLFN